LSILCRIEHLNRGQHVAAEQTPVMPHAVRDAATLGCRQMQHDLLALNDAARIVGVEEVGIDDLDIGEHLVEKVQTGRLAHGNPDARPQSDQRLDQMAAGKAGPPCHEDRASTVVPRDCLVHSVQLWAHQYLVRSTLTYTNHAAFRCRRGHSTSEDCGPLVCLGTYFLHSFDD
jgi:hypothetical protein